MKGRFFRLDRFLNKSVQFGSGSLIEAGFSCESAAADGLQQAQRAVGNRIGRVFRAVPGDFDVGLGGKIVYFIRGYASDQPYSALESVRSP